jgi:hypothetical protein
MHIFYFVISLAASIVGAISGIGGGVIIKPVLDSIGSFDVRTISFLSGNTVLAMTISTLVQSRKNEIRIDKKKSTFLALGGIIGGLMGKYLFDIIRSTYGNEQVIGETQSLLLMLLIGGVIVFTVYKEKIKPHRFGNIFFCISTGVLLGGIASFLGIGGGPINLTILYLFFAMDSKSAALNSIYIIFFSQLTNLIFTVVMGNVPEFPPLTMLLMITGGVVGGITGSMITKRMSHKGVDYLFTGVMVVIVFINLCNFIRWILL